VTASAARAILAQATGSPIVLLNASSASSNPSAVGSPLI
jgi:hypothetical protein